MSALLLESLRAWWPETILSFGALGVLLLGAWVRPAGPSKATSNGGLFAAETSTTSTRLFWIASGVILVASGVALWFSPTSPDSETFFGLIICDPLSRVLRWIALATTALVILMVVDSREVVSHRRGEYVGLLLLIGLGLMLMAEANHLLMAYVAMELVSLSSYVLVGFLDQRRSAEAALKYLFFGALSSAVMLFGMSLLFGLTGQLGFPDILQALMRPVAGSGALMMVAVTFLLAGLAFKISMVPFHMWTPDAYEGAPVPVAAFLSVGPKAAGLALLLRVMTALGPRWPDLEPLILSLTIVTMTLGNLVAIVQTNVKRLLAYSTIAQVGYLLIGFSVNSNLGLQAILVYLVAYMFMNLGVFACAVAVVNDSGNESLEAFRGLAQRSPVLAFLCTLFLLSLAGIPPLLGFFGKFLLFGAAVESGQIVLAIAGVVNSAVALYYYINLVRLMYLLDPQQARPLHLKLPLRLAVVLCGVGTLWLGLFPNELVALLRGSSFISLF